MHKLWIIIGAGLLSACANSGFDDACKLWGNCAKESSTSYCEFYGTCGDDKDCGIWGCAEEEKEEPKCDFYGNCKE